jgi:ATP synthase protein I
VRDLWVYAGCGFYLHFAYAPTLKFLDSSSMTEKHKSGPSPTAQSLSERIRKLEESQNPNRPAGQKVGMSSNGMAMAGRVTTELVAGLVVGTGIGWALDQWLDTSPLFMVVMFFLGAIAGMMNVWRALTGRGMAAGFFDENRQDNSEERMPDDNSRSD